MTTKPLLVGKNFALSIALIYSLLLAGASLINLDGIPKIDVEQGDKILHSIAYCVLLWLWFYSISYYPKFLKTIALLYAVLISFTFGIIIEVLQGVFTSTRKLDFYDIIANSIGIGLGCFIVIAYFKKDVKKK